MAPRPDLPDDVLVCILAHLDLQERHRSAVLVCRRWQQLTSSSPQLLRVVSITVRGGNAHAAARLASFSTWLLARAAQHTQRLSVEVEPPGLIAQPDISQQLSAALTAALAGVGMAGALTALRVEAVGPFAWASGLRSLRHLVLLTPVEVPLRWDTPPFALPALQELVLSGDPLELPPSAHLPLALTRLHLDGGGSLPHQITALTRLHTLSLHVASGASDSYDALACVASLRRLLMRACHHWPACLSRLTGLEALALDDRDRILDDPGEEDVQALTAALPLLTRLTLLVLDAALGVLVPPIELTSLTALRSLFWLSEAGDPLPPGPWLSGLRRLAANAHTVGCSAASLATAHRLDFLGLLSTSVDGALLGHTVNAALRAPALHHLAVWACAESVTSGVQALMDAQRGHPTVRIETRVYAWEYEDFWPCCGYDPDAPVSLDSFLQSYPW